MKKSKALTAVLNILKVARVVWFTVFFAIFAFLAFIAICDVFSGEWFSLIGAIPATIISITMWDYRRAE